MMEEFLQLFETVRETQILFVKGKKRIDELNSQKTNVKKEDLAQEDAR